MAIRQIESSFGKGSVMQLGSTWVLDRVYTKWRYTLLTMALVGA